MTLVPAAEYLEDEDLLEMVDAGLWPFIIVDEHKAAFWGQVLDRITVRTDLVLRTGGDIALAFRKNSPQLADVLNRFVTEHRAGTLMGNILLNRYLRSTTYVRNALSDEAQSRFRRLMALFELYGTEYGFEPLMLVALAYQESRLDQSLVSPRGAIGIMQVLPSTAADPVGGDSLTSTNAGREYSRRDEVSCVDP